MDQLSRYISLLDACGGDRIELDPRSRWDREQQWRHVYAAGLHDATGRWKWKSYDWHTFNYRYTKALSGDEAIAAYLRLAAPVLIVIPEEYSFASLPAYRLSAARPPQFQGSGLDVTVWPEDLDWTMAFTHEEGWCGPYFSRREWAVPDAV